MLREAVAIQDTLKYGEPPDWFFPVRESLGAALLMKGDAPAAEKSLPRGSRPESTKSAILVWITANLEEAEAVTTMRVSSRSSSIRPGRAARIR